MIASLTDLLELFSVFFIWRRSHQRTYFWWSKYKQNLPKKLEIFQTIVLEFSISIFRWLNVCVQDKVIKNKFSVFWIRFRSDQIPVFWWSKYLQNLNQKLGLTHDILVHIEIKEFQGLHDDQKIWKYEKVNPLPLSCTKLRDHRICDKNGGPKKRREFYNWPKKVFLSAKINQLKLHYFFVPLTFQKLKCNFLSIISYIFTKTI